MSDTTQETEVEQAHYANREVIFALLLKAGVFKCTIHFDGSGDSGQIEDITCEGLNEDPKNVPADVILKKIREDWTDGGWVKIVEQVEMRADEKNLYGILDQFAYHALQNCNYDWYNNDGGYGDIVIVPADKTITVDMNIRIMESENHQIEM